MHELLGQPELYQTLGIDGEFGFQSAEKQIVVMRDRKVNHFLSSSKDPRPHNLQLLMPSQAIRQYTWLPIWHLFQLLQDLPVLV